MFVIEWIIEVVLSKFYRVGAEKYGDEASNVVIHCNCDKSHFIATGKRGRCLFDLPQRYCCEGTKIPKPEKCKFDPALRCYCGREHTLTSALFLTLCKDKLKISDSYVILTK